MIDTVTFDTKITLGVIIHLIGMVALIIGLYYKLAARLEFHERRHERMEQKVNMIWKWFKIEHGLSSRAEEE